MNESEKLMKGSVHKDDFFIVHNALVSMTAKKKINWTRQNGYLHIWFLPLNVMQDGTPYSVSPVGNSPEFIPLDKCLNFDILNSLRMHSALSRYILDGEETEEEGKICASVTQHQGKFPED